MISENDAIEKVDTKVYIYLQFVIDIMKYLR